MSIVKNLKELLPLSSSRRRARRSVPARKRAATTLAVEVLESRFCLSLLISSNRTNGILRYDEKTGEFLGEFAKGGPLMRPGAMMFGPDGNLYVASNSTDDVLRYNGTTGEFMDVFTWGGELDKPSGLTFGPDGNLYVNSRGNSSVQRFDGQIGVFMDYFVPPGFGGVSGNSLGITFGWDGNLYLNSHDTDSVLQYYGKTGDFISVFASGKGLEHPGDVVIGPDGNLYVGSHSNPSAILRYNGTTGEFLDVFATGGGLRNPTGFLFAPDGILYVASRGSQSILRFDGTTGEFIDVLVGPGGQINAPTSMLFVDDGGAPGHAPASRPGHSHSATLHDPSALSVELVPALSSTATLIPQASWSGVGLGHESPTATLAPAASSAENPAPQQPVAADPLLAGLGTSSSRAEPLAWWSAPDLEVPVWLS